MAVSIASYGFDGMSYASNGKSLTDIAISQVAGQDCATWRVIKVEWPCRDLSPEQEREAVIQKWRIAQHAKQRDERYASYPQLYQEPPVDTPDPPLPPEVIAQAEAAKSRAEQKVLLAEAQKHGGKAAPQAVASTAEPAPLPETDAAADLSAGMRPEAKPAGSAPIQLAELPSASAQSSEPASSVTTLPGQTAVASADTLAVAIDTKNTAPTLDPAAAQAPADLQVPSNGISLDGQNADSLNQLPTTFIPALRQLTAARKKAIASARTSSAPASRPAALHYASAGSSVYLVLASYASRARAEQGLAAFARVPAQVAIFRADGQVHYRVVSGPYAESHIAHIRASMAGDGYHDTWAVHACRRADDQGCITLDNRQVAQHLATAR